MTASQFVLVYDISAGALTDVKQFADPRAAADAVIELERCHRGNARIHVVMLSGESLDSLKATHATYFRNGRDFVESLVGTTAA
jgi:hypothetical protein